MQEECEENPSQEHNVLKNNEFRLFSWEKLKG